MTPNWFKFKIVKRTFHEKFDVSENDIYYEPTDKWVDHDIAIDINEVRILYISGYDIIYEDLKGVVKVKNGAIINLDTGDVYIVRKSVDKFISDVLPEYNSLCDTSDLVKKLESEGIVLNDSDEEDEENKQDVKKD